MSERTPKATPRQLAQEWLDEAKYTHESSVWQRKEGHMSEVEYVLAGCRAVMLEECANALLAALGSEGATKSIYVDPELQAQETVTPPAPLREVLQGLVDAVKWYAGKFGLGPAKVLAALSKAEAALAAPPVTAPVRHKIHCALVDQGNPIVGACTCDPENPIPWPPEPVTAPASTPPADIEREESLKAQRVSGKLAPASPPPTPPAIRLAKWQIGHHKSREHCVCHPCNLSRQILDPAPAAPDLREIAIRLDEAEWWAEGFHDAHGVWPKCIKCERLAELAALAQGSTPEKKQS